MEQIRIIKEMRENDKRNGRTGKDVRPRFMVWENVPGAFSSNKGRDFKAVLEETIKIVCEEAPDIPMPDKNKWTNAGCLVGVDGEWSVAWRVLDAQFWGVPQRRRRIALIADFGGSSAPEILFERESLSGNTAESRKQGEGTPAVAESSVASTITASYATKWNGNAGAFSGGNFVIEPTKNVSGVVSKGNGDAFLISDKHTSLSTGGGQAGQGYPCVLVSENNSGVKCLNPWDAQSARIYDESGKWHSLNANENGGQSRDSVFCLQGNGIDRSDSAGCCGKGWTTDICYTLNTIDRPAVYAFAQNQRDEVRDLQDKAGALQAEPGMKQQTYIAYGFEPGVAQRIDPENRFYLETSPTIRANAGDNNDKSATQSARQYKSATDIVCYGSSSYGNYAEGLTSLRASGGDNGGGSENIAVVAAVDCRNATENADINETLQAKSNGGISYNCNNVVRTRYAVRRLTPLECERLQGLPDRWTDIGAWTDSKGKYHKESSDAARYKAIGNGIALPPWTYVLAKLNAYCNKDHTMASLFDGLGSFPLIWERLNGKGSCLWASEIEEFPIAVSTRRIVEAD